MIDPPDLEPEPDETGEPDFPDYLQAVGAEWVNVPAAEITLTNTETGEPLGVVTIPYDPENPPTEAEIIADAKQFWARLEHTRSIVTQEAVDALAENLKDAPDISGAFITSFADVVRELRVSLRPQAPGEERTGRAFELADGEDVAALEQQINRVLYDAAPDFIEVIADAPLFSGRGEHGETFWQAYARDVIAHAVRLAEEIAESELGDDAGDDAIEARVLELTHDGFLYGQEVRQLAKDWAARLSEVVQLYFGQEAEKLAAGEPSVFDDLVDVTRKRAATHSPAEPGPAAPTFDPVRAFNDAGYGHANNTLVATTARRGFLADKQTRWETDETSWPQFRHQNGQGQALLTPSPAHFPTAQDAMQAVEGYGQRHAAILRYLTAKHVAAAGMGLAGTYGGFYVAAKEIAENLGLEKHGEGGYRPDDLRDIVAVVNDLERARVLGEVEGWLPGRKKPSRLTIEANLIVLSQYVREPNMFDGERRVVGWYLRAGDWAAELEQFGPQHALTLRSLLQLHPNKYGQAFALGCHIEELFRIRAKEGNYRQPSTVASLLASAEIPTDFNTPGRQRKQLENWLDVLADPFHMRGTPLLRDWKYKEEFEPHVVVSGRGWPDKWRATGVILYPADDIAAAYAGITAKGKKAAGGRARTLEPGKPKAR